jgi:glycosyltransferase involved in cell wall biosynthesis
VVPPENPKALAEALTRLLDSTELRLQYGAEARQRARELFSQERMVQGVLSVYEEVLGRSLGLDMEE